MDDVDEDRSNAGFAALSAERQKSEILSDDEPAFTASTSDMVVLINADLHARDRISSTHMDRSVNHQDAAHPVASSTLHPSVPKLARSSRTSIRENQALPSASQAPHAVAIANPDAGQHDSARR